MFPEKYFEPLNYCAENLLNILDKENLHTQKVVEKGLMLYRQSFVSQVKFSNEYIQAVVQDVTPVKVTLDLDYIGNSNCTCHADSFCRHQLALFFYLLAQVGKVSSWLETFRKPSSKSVNLNSLGLKRASDLLKDTEEKKESYQEWIKSFQIHFQQRIEANSKQPYMIAEMYYVYMRKIKSQSPRQSEWKLLFSVVAQVFTFKQLILLSKEHDHSMQTINRYYRHILHDLISGIQTDLDKLSNFTFPFAFDDYLKQLRIDLEDLLSLQPELEFESVQLFRILWTNIFTNRDTRLQELDNRLEKEATSSFPEELGIIHLQFLLQKDNEALKRILSHKTNITSYMLYWIDYLSSRKLWKRLDLYIPFFIQELKNFLEEIDDDDFCHEFTNMVIKSLSPYCKAENKDDILEKIYIQTLPYSFRRYDDFLYTRNQLDKWIDLYTLVGFGMDYLGKDQLKTLQEYDSNLLISLYHRSIQEHIDEKNREHYRKAVRQLKKLRTLYKKQKNQQEFEQFLQIILERTKRLRAFHEECRKGKLIHAEN